MSKVEKLADGRVTLHCGDCLEVLKTLPENSIDAVVTDPPYELGFMGKSWDASGVAFCPETWRAVFNVMKPGAHLVAFGAPKNYHRLACAIEDAGFEIRDSLMWVTGQGFPKSLDVSKAIDKAAGAEPIRTGEFKRASIQRNGDGDVWNAGAFASHPEETKRVEITIPSTDAAREWSGWGTALKPAYEPIVLARKPLSEGTVAANVLRWGTGAINIDATRVSMSEDDFNKTNRTGDYGETSPGVVGFGITKMRASVNRAGRWPANLCHDGSQGVLDLFPHTKSGTLAQHHKVKGSGGASGFLGASMKRDGFDKDYGGDEGSAARFFYCAKASKQDRAGSKHPTVKPVNLMRWLVRMVTPPSGTVLDLFAGSGTTGMASILEGFDVQLIERESEYQADIRARFGERQDKDIPLCDDVADTHV